MVIDGIIEWVGEKRHKIPHLIRHRDHIPFAMAGLWNRWHDRRTNDEVWSCTVIVKDADDWYTRFHDRMAVLLAPESYDGWLDPERRRGQIDMLRSSAYHRDGELEYYPVSRLVNNPGYDGADCLEPASAEELNAPPARVKAPSPQIDLDI